MRVQIWGFEMIEGVRRHVKRAVMTKDRNVIRVRMVYDFLSTIPRPPYGLGI